MEQATALVDRYQRDLVNGAFEDAWSLLAPHTRSLYGSVAAFATERRAFLKWAGSTFRLIPEPTKVAPIEVWLGATGGADIDPAHAVIVEVDYPAVAGNNSGWELYLAAPGSGGALELWMVR